MCRALVHDNLGWKNQTTWYILLRHWPYEWFSRFHSCGTYSVLSWSHSIVSVLNHEFWLKVTWNYTVLSRAPFTHDCNKLLYGFMYCILIQWLAVCQVIVTNTVPHEVQKMQCHKIRTVDISSMLSEAIRRIHNAESMSHLFQNLSSEDWFCNTTSTPSWLVVIVSTLLKLCALARQRCLVVISLFRIM